MLLILVVFALTHGSDELSRKKGPVVTLKCGKVKGRNTDTPHGPVKEFFQIPYGIPPVGQRRWRHSELLQPDGSGRCWDAKEYDASVQTKIKCVQYWKSSEGLRGQEDCLYLSVREPLTHKDLLPVVVWIHGGSLMSGWSDEVGYAPTAEFTAHLNVVTVNLNYRLDVMGFFSAPEIWEDGVSYGNFGYGDVITALKWVQANIAQFGGDPTSVTLLGESSGANAVLGLLVAPKAVGLFHKAIALSSAPKLVATYKDAYMGRSTYVSDVGCNKKTLAERRACLKAAPIETLSAKQDISRGYGFYDFPYGDGLRGESMDYAVIEPTIVPVSPHDIDKLRHLPGKGNSKKIKIIMSNTAQENGYNPLYYKLNMLYSWKDAHTILQDRVENMEKFVKMRTRVSTLVKDIEDHYDFGVNKTGWWPQMYWDTLTTDIRATCTTNVLAKDINKNRRYEVYRMYITQRPRENICNLSFDTIHGWDTEALFGYGWFKLQSSQDRHQRRFKENMRDLVEYFAKGKDIENWDTHNTLIMNNLDFPASVTFERGPPQDDKCKFWQRVDFLKYGWQN